MKEERFTGSASASRVKKVKEVKKLSGVIPIIMRVRGMRHAHFSEEVKCSEDGDEIGTVKRRLPSSLDIMINGLGALNEKRNKSGERFLHRVVALALKNKLNDAAQREGYNGCLLVPEKLDRFSLPKTLLVCEHRFKYDALKTAGYKV